VTGLIPATAFKGIIMIKFLFFDYREIETIQGFTKILEQPLKCQNPIFIADAPWENSNMQFYGSVIKVPDKPFQMWYTFVHKPWHMYLAYAESDDGIIWHRPLLDVFKFNDEKTNVIMTENPHGVAVIYDRTEQRDDWRYKMVAGTDPSGCICAYRSADGIHWRSIRRFPVIGTNPDCPMGFLRAPNGRYAVYHRLYGYGRRVFRSESHDFIYWDSEPRMVFEPDAGDPPQVQFYGMGSTAYGPYEIGTLWLFHTDSREYGTGKMRGYQEAELTYARSGYAWHRLGQGTPFIPHGQEGDWDQGNLQCASAPVYLDDEIRYYYAGTDMFHKTHWELEPQRAGLGMASVKPDRFAALQTGNDIAELLTCTFTLPSMRVFINASTAENGWVRIEILDAEARLIEGFTENDCASITGDSISHSVQWKGSSDLTGKAVRFRVRAKNASIYSIYIVGTNETPVYYRFSTVRS